MSAANTEGGAKTRRLLIAPASKTSRASRKPGYALSLANRTTKQSESNTTYSVFGNLLKQAVDETVPYIGSC